jgi:hypothetical protein
VTAATQPLPHAHDPSEIEDFARWLAAAGDVLGVGLALSRDSGPGGAARPDDPAAVRERGRAHLWSGEPRCALETLAPLHRSRPWDREVQYLMLDALFLMGKSEADYPWTAPPPVVRVDPPLLDRCHRLLAGERRPATVFDLVLAAATEGYPAFQAQELLAALEADPRFAVRRSGLAPEGAVVVSRADRRAALGTAGCPGPGVLS